MSSFIGQCADLQQYDQYKQQAYYAQQLQALQQIPWATFNQPQTEPQPDKKLLLIKRKNKP